MATQRTIGSSPRPVGRVLRFFVGLSIVFGVIAVVAARPTEAAAVVSDLQSTDPIDGASVKGPLETVVLTFTGSVTVASGGVAVFHLDGSTVRPSETTETLNPAGGTVITVRFDPGLGPGTYGVRWSVESTGGGSRDGQFQFTVASPPETTVATTIPPTVATTKPTSPPLETLAPVSPGTTDGAAIPATTVPVTTVPPTTVPPVSQRDDPSQIDDDSLMGTLGQAFRFGGTIAALGAIAALLWVVQSDKQDIALLLTWVRMFGLVIAIGGVLEWARALDLAGNGFGATLGSRPGVAALSAGIGGLLITFGLTERHSLAPAGDEFSWRPGLNSAAGLFGAVLALTSFGLVGRESVRGPQTLLGVAAVVHVAVVAVWAGGVFALTLVSWVRRQRRVPARTALSVVRFAPLAIWSLVLATISGIGMDILIAQSPTDPMSSPWGRMLVVKLILVTIAIAAGGFNRFVLLPAIQNNPDDPDLARRVRVSLTIESVVFVLVVVVTVALVTQNAGG